MAHASDPVILVVEDDRDVRQIVVRQLEMLGYRSVEAEDGSAALSLLERGADVDLLFTDLVMPHGLDGVDLARRAREIRPGLSVLFTSGYSHGTLEGRAETELQGPLLEKPYRRGQLAAKLREVLGDA